MHDVAALLPAQGIDMGVFPLRVGSVDLPAAVGSKATAVATLEIPTGFYISRDADLNYPALRAGNAGAGVEVVACVCADVAGCGGGLQSPADRAQPDVAGRGLHGNVPAHVPGPDVARRDGSPQRTEVDVDPEDLNDGADDNAADED